MKIFDIVYVMTNGDFNTNVIGNEFFNQLFTNFNNGAAAAIVVHADDRDRPDHGLPGAPLPTRGGDGMTRHSPRPAAAAATAEDAASAPAARRATPQKAGWFARIVVLGPLLPVDRARRSGSSSRRSARATTPTTTGWWTLFSTPSAWSSLTFDNYRPAIDQADLGPPSSTASPSRCRRRSSRSWSRRSRPTRSRSWSSPAATSCSSLVVSLLVVPNYVAFVPILRIYGDLGIAGTFPRRLAGAHRLRHVAGDLHPAQLHGDAAQEP